MQISVAAIFIDLEQRKLENVQKTKWDDEWRLIVGVQSSDAVTVTEHTVSWWLAAHAIYHPGSSPAVCQQNSNIS